MSVYLKKAKGWRYDFTHKGLRYTMAWFRTKKEALRAEALKKEEIKNPQPTQETKTDMGFLELVNIRLDHVKAYNSASHYRDYCYMARRWVTLWGGLSCEEITTEMIEKFVLKRSKVSAFTANKEIRYLRATFNFGQKKKLVKSNPTKNLDFLPVEKRVKHIPPTEDIEKVIKLADHDTQDYLYAICDTMARVSEINRLCWDDVDLNQKAPYVILYTRKKKGGHLTPRKVPMTTRLFKILSRRHGERDPEKPWVFWHRYFSRKEQAWKEGPYRDRKNLMKGLCKKANVRYFRFHPLRHAGASVMENNQVPVGAIQRILGHENRTTTEIYLHSLGNSEIEAVKTLERAREVSHTNSHTEQKST